MVGRVGRGRTARVRDRRPAGLRAQDPGQVRDEVADRSTALASRLLGLEDLHAGLREAAVVRECELGLCALFVHGAQILERAALELGRVTGLEQALDAFRGNHSLVRSEQFAVQHSRRSIRSENSQSKMRGQAIPPLTGGSTATSSPSASVVARPDAGLVAVQPEAAVAEHRGEGRAVRIGRRVEERADRGNLGAVEFVDAPTGGFTRRGEQPQRDGHDGGVSTLVRAVGYASSRSGSIGSPVTSSTP